MNDRELVELYNRTQDATQAVHAKAEEIYEMAQELERLTKDTPPSTPARGLEWRRGRP